MELKGSWDNGVPLDPWMLRRTYQIRPAAGFEPQRAFRKLRVFLTKRSPWVNEEFIVLDRRGIILHATERALHALRNNRHGIDDDAPTRFFEDASLR
jgi:hypothetical protein